jgi:hypothetical protein
LGTTTPAAKAPKEAAGYASQPSSQTASQALRPPRRNLQEATDVQAVSDQSDIVIRKVKTQPIAPGTW